MNIGSRCPNCGGCFNPDVPECDNCTGNSSLSSEFVSEAYQWLSTPERDDKIVIGDKEYLLMADGKIVPIETNVI